MDQSANMKDILAKINADKQVREAIARTRGRHAPPSAVAANS